MFEHGFNSVRLRLTFWYVAVLGLVLIGFSAGVYTLLAQSAHDKVDEELAGAINVLELSLRHEVEEHQGDISGERAYTAVVDMVYRDSFPGIAIATYARGRQVAAKPGLGGFVPEAPEAAGSSMVYQDADFGPEPGRCAVIQVSVAPLGEYQFVAWTSLLPVQAEMASHRRVFFLAIPLALLAAAIGGFLLARKSLAPVVAMSETAGQISSRDLSQRIAVANPKDELGQLASTFNQLLERLEKSFTRQRQFMADSSHELRTPLYVAHTAAQVTLEQPGRPEADYREALATIDQQIRRLNRLVDDMFLLAHADAGVYPLDMTEFYLDEAVAECVRAAKLLGVRRQIQVAGPDPAELPCHGDEGLIRQLIMNLLDNAVKYTPSGGEVRLSLDNSQPDFYALEVRDTGPGIPPEAQARIFDRFYRVDKARTRSAAHDAGGAGLGLAIAKWIAEVHGGQLTLASSGPDGSTFRATFRRAPARPVTASRPAVSGSTHDLDAAGVTPHGRGPEPHAAATRAEGGSTPASTLP